MGKFIIEKEDKEAVYLMYADEDGDVMVEGAYLTPYIEPDREKAAADAFQRGYEHAKHECADCRKIRADTEQELADNAYQRGLDDAWDAARKIIHMPEGDLLNIFTECYSAVCTSVQVFLKYDASEAIEKIRQYEQGKEEYHIGDEVIRHYKNEFMEGDDTPSIFLSEEDGYFRCLAFNGRSIMIAEYPKNQYRKTGRYFPEIAAVLEKMREDAT